MAHYQTIQFLHVAVEVVSASDCVAALIERLYPASPAWWRTTTRIVGQISISPVENIPGRNTPIENTLHKDRISKGIAISDPSDSGHQFLVHARWCSSNADEKHKNTDEKFISTSLGALAEWLYWTTTAVAATYLGRDYCLVHAGVVGRAQQALVLPAPSGAGKSTLVTALALSGYHYLSDEIAVIDRDSLRIWPFPKSVGLRPHSSHILSREYPRWETDVGDIWIVPHALGTVVSPACWLPAGPAESLEVTHIVFPQWEPGRTSSELRPLRRSEALLKLLAQRYGLAEGRDFGSFAMAMTEFVRRARCYALRVGTLRSAVVCIDRLLAGDEPGPTPAQADPLAAQSVREGIELVDIERHKTTHAHGTHHG